ncbi:MAG: PilZ domain-containing protein [Bacteriovoracaceae bacterium]|jgi:hypothetical protein|nr:PilZ domain-containing protein [Bacteriovoracaceae bacterium]
MRKRPFFFVFLTIVHLIEPLIKIFYFKALTHFSWDTIFQNLMSLDSPKLIFDFWFVFPLAGWALFGVKKWSYPLFLSLQFYSVLNHVFYQKYAWPYVSETPFLTNYLILFCNVSIIVYFLIPSVRKPFFDPKVRWWETDNRYSCTIPCTLTDTKTGQSISCHILNISTTGVFTSQVFDSTEEQGTVKIQIHHGDTELLLSGKTMNIHRYKNTNGTGIKFDFTNIWEKIAVLNFVSKIKKGSKHILPNAA